MARLAIEETYVQEAVWEVRFVMHGFQRGALALDEDGPKAKTARGRWIESSRSQENQPIGSETLIEARVLIVCSAHIHHGYVWHRSRFRLNDPSQQLERGSGDLISNVK